VNELLFSGRNRNAGIREQDMLKVSPLRGTEGSNPVSYGRQSANLRFLSGGAKSAGRRGGNYGIDYLGPDCAALGLLGIYLYDPNGIPLEFACQPEDGEAHRRCSPASLRRKRKRVANWRPYRASLLNGSKHASSHCPSDRATSVLKRWSAVARGYT
jgi:hypothetical protein